MKKFLWVLAVGIVLTGCKQHVAIINGELPAGVIPYASKFMGEYDGSFDGRPLRLSLALSGKKVVLNASADWLSPECASNAGELQEVYVKNKKGHETVITNAIFAFDAGKCMSQVWGRRLEITMKDKNPLRLKVALFGGTYSRWSCGAAYPGPYYPGPGYPSGYWGPGHPGWNGCHEVLESHWLTGAFRKI